MRMKLLGAIAALSVLFTAGLLHSEIDISGMAEPVLVIAKSAEATSISLGTDNTVNLRGEINDESVDAAIRQIYALEAKRGTKDYPIYLVIDSPGGSIDSGENFIEAVKTVRNLKTVTINAASMASAIVQALSGERLIVESGMQMYHRAAGSVSGYFEDGEIESRLAYIKSVVRRMEQRSADRLGISLQDYKAKVVREWWMTAQQSIDARAADRTVNVKCTPELINTKQITTVNMLFFQVEVEISACPLLKLGEMKQPKE